MDNYKNFISMALRLKENELAENFIKSYKEYLLPEYKKNAFFIGYAMLYNVNENYVKALKMLAKVESKDFYQATFVYNLQLRLYYELDLTEPAINLIDTYKKFFPKHELIPINLKNRYKNFLKYFYFQTNRYHLRNKM